MYNRGKISQELLKRVRDYQSKMSCRVVKYDTLTDIRYVCGVDVAYDKYDTAYAVAVVVDLNSKEEVDKAYSICKVYVPYISTYLFLREGAPMLRVLRRLASSYDIILIDGNGILHPRYFGVACYIGMLMDKPSIGVSKSLLCGHIIDDDVVLDGIIIGKVLRLRNKSIYVSIGNKVSLDTAVSIVKALSYPTRYMQELPLPLPLPLLLAHRYASALRRSQA